MVGTVTTQSVDEEGLATAATQDDAYPGDLAGIALTAIVLNIVVLYALTS